MRLPVILVALLGWSVTTGALVLIAGASAQVLSLSVRASE